jgi:7-cyano-7-deazaguanine synthase
MIAVCIVSGGMDSVTMAYYLSFEGYEVHALSFDYGQKHKKELDYARASMVGVVTRHDVIDLSPLGKLLSGSALTDDIEIPDGHYADDNMKITVVPNRNAIMLSIAYGVAVARGAQAVGIGVHAGDHFIYPDCRPEFINLFGEMQNKAIEGYGTVKLLTPFINKTKSDIVTIGTSIGVPFNKTWSCYKGQEIHCGTCGTCQERKEAFRLAGIQDPTQYLR